MNEIGNRLKGYILLITYGVVLYLGVSHIDQVLSFSGKIMTALTPFILGILFAFVLNILMSFLERKLFKNIEKSKIKFLRKLKRPLSIITTYLLVFAFIMVIMQFLIPQLSQYIITFSKKI